jgi:hypothetical protein
MAAKPIYPDLSSSVSKKNTNESNQYINASAPVLEDTRSHNYSKHKNSRSNQQKPSTQSKFSTPINSQLTEQRHDSEEDVFDENREQNTSTIDSNGVVFLLDANEHLTVR